MLMQARLRRTWRFAERRTLSSRQWSATCAAFAQFCHRTRLHPTLSPHPHRWGRCKTSSWRTPHTPSVERGSRRFARFSHAEDPRHEVPPGRLFDGKRGDGLRTSFARRTPALSRMAARLGPPARCAPIPTAPSGLVGRDGTADLRRRSRYRFKDVTPDGLVIRETKFRKSRLVPCMRRDLGLQGYLANGATLRWTMINVFVSGGGDAELF